MQPFRRLLSYMRPYLVEMVAAVLMLSLAGALMALVLAVFEPLVNEVLLKVPSREPLEATAQGGAGLPGVLAERLSWLPIDSLSASIQRASEWLRRRSEVKIPLLFVAIYFVRGIVLYCGQYLMTKTGVSVIRDLRMHLYESLIQQSWSFFKVHQTGQIMSRLLSDVQRLQRLSTGVLADLVRIAAQMPFILLLIFITNWRMSLFSMLVVPMLAYPMLRIGRRLRKASHRSQESTAEVADLLSETVLGIKVVQGFTMEDFEIGRFRDALSRVWKVDLKAGRAMAWSSPVMEFIGAIAGATLFYVAGVSIASGTVDVGDFVVVLTGLVILFGSLRHLSRINIVVQQALAAAARVFEMMDWERQISDAVDARPLPTIADRIRFESVDFAYQDEKVLEGIDLDIRLGEMVALVGPSGSGKSTLANLLPRFLDPTAGRLTIDGHDLRDLTLASLRQSIGLITQETILFADTVLNNITCGRHDIPLERVAEVARAAQAHDFIERLPQGYDTVLGEGGGGLSMGQRQRLAIARALLKDPPILILDEATSALDAESEAKVQRALSALLQGRASLVIAHRLATVRRADRIVVLQAGRIVAQGPHRELLEQDGLYARLYEYQFQDGEPALDEASIGDLGLLP